MLKRRLFLLVITVAFLCKINFAQVPSSSNLPVMNFYQLEPLLHQKNDTVYLVNFWATWCVPCVKELPAIEKVEAKYKQNRFRVLLVSLDMPKELDKRLLPFISSHQIKSEVILLDDPHQDMWINKVDPGWAGEIPFTLIYGKDFRQSYSKSFNFNELDSIINNKLHIL
jgi:thiol-disulfide isomerase/thioredoxin